MHTAQDDLPFGGIGASGIGAYHGIEGFHRLSHAKGIYAQGRWNVATLLRPPFGRWRNGCCAEFGWCYSAASAAPLSSTDTRAIWLVPL